MYTFVGVVNPSGTFVADLRIVVVPVLVLDGHAGLFSPCMSTTVAHTLVGTDVQRYSPRCRPLVTSSRNPRSSTSSIVWPATSLDLKGWLNVCKRILMSRLRE